MNKKVPDEKQEIGVEIVMKKENLLIIFVVLVILGVIFYVVENSSATSASSTAKQVTQQKPVIHDIKYEVTGTARTADITYSNKDGGTSQLGRKYLPWTHEFKTNPNETFTFLYVSAQINDGISSSGYGTVITKIYVDGKLRKTSESTGQYVIASSSDSL